MFPLQSVIHFVVKLFSSIFEAIVESLLNSFVTAVDGICYCFRSMPCRIHSDVYLNFFINAAFHILRAETKALNLS